MSVFTEMQNFHPSSIRRVLTSEEFTHCEILYKWRPELKQPGMVLHTKKESDKVCEKYTTVFKKLGRGSQVSIKDRITVSTEDTLFHLEQELDRLNRFRYDSAYKTLLGELILSHMVCWTATFVPEKRSIHCCCGR